MERFLAGDGWLDAEIDDSFPASDPLSHWAGPRRRKNEADRAQPEEKRPGTQAQ